MIGFRGMNRRPAAQMTKHSQGQGKGQKLPGLGERAKGIGTEKQREHRHERRAPGVAWLEGRRPAGGTC